MSDLVLALRELSPQYLPHCAGCPQTPATATLGLAGALANRIRLDRPRHGQRSRPTMTAAGLTLTISSSLIVVIAAQIILALLVVTASIHLSILLQDDVPSAVRAGVPSGVSAFTWLASLPLALGSAARRAARSSHRVVDDHRAWRHRRCPAHRHGSHPGHPASATANTRA